MEHDKVNPVVSVTRQIPGEIQLPGVQVRTQGEDLAEREQTLTFISGSDVVVSMYTDRVDEAFLKAAGPNLKGVCNFAVGHDNIDLAACASRQVIVTNTPHAVTEGTADMVWALLLAVTRRVVEADRFVRTGEFARHGNLGMAEFLGQDLTGRTLLIVGAGRIGYATALRSIGWGMHVLYVARRRHWSFELAPLAATRVTLEEGLEQADVVSVHTPLTTDTRHLIDEAAFKRMKETAILINTARGPVVDEKALVLALREGWIFGAGLDVFEQEPQVQAGLMELDNVVLTPHVGSGARRYREEMTAMVCENARAILQGVEPLNRIG